MNLVVDIAAIQREVGNLSGIHGLGKARGLCVHRGDSISDFYDLCAFSQEKLKVDTQHGASVQHQIASLRCFKAVGLDADHVSANVQFLGCADTRTVRV